MIKKELRSIADKKKAKLLAGFFKTAPGQYGEGDIFLGITVPKQRLVAKKYRNMPLRDVVKLLHSKEHEFRFTALLLLVDRYKRSDLPIRRKIFEVYLANTRWINNWDLVDTTAPTIVGQSAGIDLLEKLAYSRSLWERRIAILATFAYIKKGDWGPSFRVAKILLHDRHDLIHKAVGWMLREVGKNCGIDIERKFLDKYHKIMPRTMLRYAIERFPAGLKRRYM